MRRRCAGLLLLLTLLGLTAGCRNVIGAIGYYFRPRQIQKPEHQFAAGARVALVIDTARPEDENPVFNQALYERAVEMLREAGSRAKVLPLQAVIDLRRANPDFHKWSIQKIGRELEADEVLYVRVDRLIIREEPDHPLLTPTVEMRLKVIGVSEPPVHARLWPEEKEGRPVRCARQVSRTNGQRSAKPQPAGGRERSGGEPGIEISSLSKSRMLGNAFFNPNVYGCHGCSNSRRVGAHSTSLPAYITPMRSAVCAITPMSCVISRIEDRTRSRISRMRRNSRSCTRTSSPVVGSSITSNAGSKANAIEIIAL